ncbi:putative branched-chain amino acid transport system protein 2 [Azorhizobium caulinodans ORS 571]|uniref:Putative branched-chain amino acid transport system protein 2 n=1 Tax=Azorhizobium caulinodans (strain ATCC 43989 / DSM 5975 / JCM 20966 / LMG 6465 / NBRC 14845 / NCIMB 13405 / ORS 571) TaxID=438753 RepID=A8I2J8_AZOC5|nr:ABC transporter ATP-binding protein [Azorhizobium caulinodans]BAF87885.1 putative branched-chain amino acid transport system protein 2 [Azorhizobium caulinodans ORS 571]
MSPLLAINDLRVGYGQVEALFGASLTVAPGTIVTVVGPNGAGKSTLLNAVAALIPKRSGRIAFAGQNTDGLSTEELAACGMALVPERRDLFGSMSVEDNLLLGAYLRRSNHKAIADSLEEIFARFPRLKERRAQEAGTLSGGERQMLAIGRALMCRPRLLLLDEPSLGLAPQIVRNVFDVIDSLRATGVSVLLVEQNAQMALRIADYAYVLETGEIVNQGTGAALLHDPRVMETYLGIGHGSYAD